MDKCPTCGKPMVLYDAPHPGDPGFLCLTDDADHRAAADARKAERVRLLSEAKGEPSKAERDAKAELVARETVRP